MTGRLSGMRTEIKNYVTAKDMALSSHNLSRDGMSATRADGTVWKWSNHFNVWAGPFPAMKGDPKAPRRAI